MLLGLIMSERVVVGGPVVVAENGALKTVAMYYAGYLDLGLPVNAWGTHIEGWTGPETCVLSKMLMVTRVIEVIEFTSIPEGSSS